MRKITRILAYAIPQWPLLLALFVAAIVGSLLGALQPWPLKILIDNVVNRMPLPEPASVILSGVSPDPSPARLLALVAVGSLLLFALQSALDAFGSWGWTVAGRRVVYRLAEDVFSRLQRRSLLYHGRTPVGETVTVITGDCWAVLKIFELVMFGPARAFLGMAFMLVLMFQLHSGLTWITLGAAVLAVIASGIAAGPLRRVVERQRRLEGTIRSHVQQTLTGISLVQAFSQEERELRRFSDNAAAAIRALQRRTILGGFNGLVSGLILVLANAVVLWSTATAAIAGDITIGAVLVFTIYVNDFRTHVRTLTAVYPGLQGLSASLNRLNLVLSAAPEIAESRNAQPLTGVRGDITFDHVSFSYGPSRPALRDVSFRCSAGNTVALVGPTGAGKTTLVSLIPRFFDPSQGQVLVDGKDLRDLQLKTLRAHIAIVLQEPFLFPMTLAENIAYGRPGANRADVERAAGAANAHDFISRLPNGYDTMLGERGATLSGGERQRIAIARALLKDAPILILDEPTSAVDAETEALILDAMQALIRGRTTFIIAHRLATVRNATRILVLEGGTIVEAGTHAELIRRPGVYARYAKLQFGAEPRALEI